MIDLRKIKIQEKRIKTVAYYKIFNMQLLYFYIKN